MAFSRTSSRNGWDYLQGFTGPQSVRPLGPTGAATGEIPSTAGRHYVSVYQHRPSSVMLRMIFDPDANHVSPGGYFGYMQFLRASVCGAPVALPALPGMTRRRFYEAGGWSLDMMGPKDAQARLGAFPAILPWYPLTAVQSGRVTTLPQLGLADAPNGALYTPGGLRPPDAALGASLQALVAPFGIDPAALEAICTPETANYDAIVGQPDASRPLPDLVNLYLQATGRTPAAPYDVIAVGANAVFVMNDELVLVVRPGDMGQAGLPLRIWEFDYETYDHLEGEATRAVLISLQAAYVAQHPSAALPQRGTGRGWGGLNPPPEITWANQGGAFPLLKLQVLSLMVENRPRRAEVAKYDIISHGGVLTTLTWTYEPVVEAFELEISPPEPHAVSEQEWVVAGVKRFQALMRNPPAEDTIDLSAFTLAGAPWLDTPPPWPGS